MVCILYGIPALSGSSACLQVTTWADVQGDAAHGNVLDNPRYHSSAGYQTKQNMPSNRSTSYHSAGSNGNTYQTQGSSGSYGTGNGSYQNQGSYNQGYY